MYYARQALIFIEGLAVMREKEFPQAASVATNLQKEINDIKAAQNEALALLREYSTSHKPRPDLNERAVKLFRKLAA